MNLKGTVHGLKGVFLPGFGCAFEQSVGEDASEAWILVSRLDELMRDFPGSNLLLICKV